MTPDLSKTQSIGIVLSGGGVRGMAHIGLLKALDSRGLEPQILSGTSVGAIIGGLYASGYDSQEMLDFFKETPLFHYNFLSINKPGLLNTDRYSELFKTYFPENSFEALKKKLYVTTTNLQRGTQEVFSHGELIRPLLASAALPPVFSPVEINKYLYADGGIMNNFPAEPLQGQCNLVIGSNVSVVREVAQGAIRNSLQLANRTTALMIYAINHRKMAGCHLLFQPPGLEAIGVLDKKSLHRAYQIGYDHACQQLDTVMK